MLVIDLRVEGQNLLGSLCIDMLCRIVGQVVREIGADDDQGFSATPQTFKYFGDFLGAGVADGERNQ